MIEDVPRYTTEEVVERFQVELLRAVVAQLKADIGSGQGSITRLNINIQRILVEQAPKVAKALSSDMDGLVVLNALEEAERAITAEDVLQTASQAVAGVVAGNQSSYTRLAAPQVSRMMQEAAQWSRQAYVQESIRCAAKAQGSFGEPGIGYEASLRESITRLCEQGITSYAYRRKGPKGETVVRVPVDVAARRVLTVYGRQAQNEGTLDLAKHAGENLVEVSVTRNPRASHEVWQGRIYSLFDDSKYPLFSEVVGDHINDYNCGHRVRIYREGMERLHDPLDGTGCTPEEARKAVAKQRRLENDVRKLKREHEVLKANDLDTKDVNRRLREKRGQLKEHIAANAGVCREERHRLTIGEAARRKAGMRGRVHVTQDQRKRIVRAKCDKAHSKQSGGVSGALNDRNDPDMERRTAHAKRYYASVRNRDKGREVEAVARSSGLDAGIVSRAYDHLFINEHNLAAGRKRFDPDYEIAESWRRLRSGKGVKEHDVILIQHEEYESFLMRGGMEYEQAHDAACTRYNYQQALKDYLKGGSGDGLS